MKYVVYWGNGSTGREAGVLGAYDTQEEAEAKLCAFFESNDNSAVGAWIRLEGDDDAGDSC